MNSYYADLHIHIGRTNTGKPVKITGAKSLTLSNIISHARDEKGLNMIGIIDSHSPEVIQEMEDLINSGEMIELPQGGLRVGALTILTGSELEIYDENCQGPIHVLCYFPTLMNMKRFSEQISKSMKNINLSSQRIYITGRKLQIMVKELGGLFIPAHVFTPFKSLYGKGVKYSLKEVFDPNLIDGIELGLSANTEMADKLAELHPYTYLSNSDAHSLGKIAREYQIIRMENPSFAEFEKVLKEEDGRGIEANCGLDPLLGKYHTTVCASCLEPILNESTCCVLCGKGKLIKGVAERIEELKSSENSKERRPPYIHQVPLDFIPGLGPKMLERLLQHFGTEMAVLHEVPYTGLCEAVPEKIAKLIVKAREGRLELNSGGGGRYGKVMESES